MCILSCCCVFLCWGRHILHRVELGFLVFILIAKIHNNPWSFASYLCRMIWQRLFRKDWSYTNLACQIETVENQREGWSKSVLGSLNKWLIHDVYHRIQSVDFFSALIFFRVLIFSEDGTSKSEDQTVRIKLVLYLEFWWWQMYFMRTKLEPFFCCCFVVFFIADFY